METQGFCLLKDDADFRFTMGVPEGWKNKPLLAMEINDKTKSVLLLNGTEVGMFDFKDVNRMFKCKRQGDVLIPIGLNMMEEMMYCSLALSRNGGYSPIMMKMVMASSILRGEFCDSVVWQKGQDPDVVAQAKALTDLAKERTKKVKDENS